MNNPPPPPQIPVKFSMGAVVASAFIYPGAGQFIQRRPLWGLAYALVFSAFFVAFGVYAGTIIYNYYSLIDPKAEVAPHLPMIRMLVTFGAAMFVYVANIADAVAASWLRVKKTK